MAFIWSNDERFNKKPPQKNEVEHNFVSFWSNSSCGTISAGVGRGIMAQTTLSPKVLVGYDDEKREFIIKQTQDGNLKVCRKTQTPSIAVTKFLLGVGFTKETAPQGRYFADVDENGYIHAYLNRPLEIPNNKTKKD